MEALPKLFADLKKGYQVPTMISMNGLLRTEKLNAKMALQRASLRARLFESLQNQISKGPFNMRFPFSTYSGHKHLSMYVHLFTAPRPGTEAFSAFFVGGSSGPHSPV